MWQGNGPARFNLMEAGGLEAHERVPDIGESHDILRRTISTLSGDGRREEIWASFDTLTVASETFTINIVGEFI